MASKEIGDYDYSSLTPDILLAHMAALTILKKRVDRALGAAKTEYLRTHNAGDPAEGAVLDGVDAATVTVKADGEGRYEASDPLAYADFLAHYGIDCEGQPAYTTVNYPTEGALRPRFLERLIREHGGEVPDGVVFRPGRAGGVTVTLGRGVADRAWSASSLAPVALEAAGAGETHTGE